MLEKIYTDYHKNQMVNKPPIPESWETQLEKGQPAIIRHISRITKKVLKQKDRQVCRIAIDGHLGVPWKEWAKALEQALQRQKLRPEIVDMISCWKSSSAIQRMVRPNMPKDPTFGRIYDGKLEDFFNLKKIDSLYKKLDRDVANATQPNVIICLGSGSAGMELADLYDATFYIDIVREEILKRLKMGLAFPVGEKPVPVEEDEDKPALPAYFSTRRFYYVDYPVLDKHRKDLLAHVDYYIDGNALKTPKMIPGEQFRGLLLLLCKGPIKTKPYYDPSPWGGTWLKKVRKLPRKMINCAWSYDLIEPETSFLVEWGKTQMEFPFPLLAGLAPREILGSKGSKKKFAGQFPIRINYDDGYNGNDMALQSHPNDAYIGEHFNEPYRQDESYYIVDTAPNAGVHLGLTEDADIEEFRRAVVQAEKKSIPFDHRKFVNYIPSEPGDLFLIPAGTVHGSGRNQNVLEISATTYRYTFHFYDFLRPGLDGKLRTIHSDHAFNNLRSERRTRWVLKNLKQEPRLLKKGKGWAEYLLGTRRDMFFKVQRVEFDKQYQDNTQGEFHLLVVVEGKGIRAIPWQATDSAAYLPFSCMLLMPASVGKYRIES